MAIFKSPVVTPATVFAFSTASSGSGVGAPDWASVTANFSLVVTTSRKSGGMVSLRTQVWPGSAVSQFASVAGVYGLSVVTVAAAAAFAPLFTPGPKRARWIASISAADWERQAAVADLVLAGESCARLDDLDASIAIGVFDLDRDREPNGERFGRLKGCILMAWPKGG